MILSISVILNGRDGVAEEPGEGAAVLLHRTADPGLLLNRVLGVVRDFLVTPDIVSISS